MKRTSSLYQIMLFCCLMCQIASAQDTLPKSRLHYGIGLNVGTAGIGLDAALRINKNWGVTLGYNYFNLGFDKSPIKVEQLVDIEEKIISNYSILQSNITLKCYYAPFRNKNINFVGGFAYLYQNKFAADFELANPIQINDVIFTPEEIGKIAASVTNNKIAPILAMSFNRMIPRRYVNVALEMGVLYRGKPITSLDFTGIFDNETNRRNEEILNSNLKSYQWHPYFNIRIGFRIK